MRLVVDASFVVATALDEGNFDAFAAHDLTAPELLWSESLSALHELHWRGATTTLDTELARDCLGAAPIARGHHPELRRTAWEIADALGWAKTYDAEYVALARLLDCPLLTLDARLKRGAERAIRVLGPLDLER